MFVSWAREEVHEVNSPLLGYISSLKNIGRWEVLLLGCACRVMGRSDAEISALVFVKESGEDGGRVVIWPGRHGQICIVKTWETHQHMKSTLPSVLTRAVVRILPIKP